MIIVAIIPKGVNQITGKIRTLTAILQLLFLNAALANLAILGPEHVFWTVAPLTLEPFRFRVGMPRLPPPPSQFLRELAVVRSLPNRTDATVHSASRDRFPGFSHPVSSFTPSAETLDSRASANQRRRTNKRHKLSSVHLDLQYAGELATQRSHVC